MCNTACTRVVQRARCRCICAVLEAKNVAEFRSHPFIGKLTHFRLAVFSRKKSKLCLAASSQKVNVLEKTASFVESRPYSAEIEDMKSKQQ